MPSAGRLALAATTTWLAACDPTPEAERGPVESIAPEGIVDVAEFRGVARIGESSDWHNGAPIAAGDLDGDGLDDLLVPRWRELPREQSSEDETRIVYGADPPPPRRASFAAIGPAIRAIHVPGGAAIALGDIDGDARGEMLAADFTEPLFRGGRRLSGDVDISAADLELQTTLPHAFFPAGDLDGDGDDDVGVVTDSRRLGVWLGGPDVLGPPGSTQAVRPQVVPIRGARDAERHFGVHLAPGDLDADGLDDLVYMVDDESDGSWGVEIVYGREHFAIDPPTAPDGRLVPEAYPLLAGLGDFDGDGRADILSRTHAGDVSLILSSALGTDRLLGEHALSDLGIPLTHDPLVHLAWAGDIDADGTDDIVGMRDDADGIAVLVWYGTVGTSEPPDGPHATITFPHTVTGSPSTLVGDSAFALVGAGDLDGDGFGELAATTDGTLWMFYGGPREAAARP